MGRSSDRSLPTLPPLSRSLSRDPGFRRIIRSSINLHRRDCRVDCSWNSDHGGLSVKVLPPVPWRSIRPGRFLPTMWGNAPGGSGHDRPPATSMDRSSSIVTWSEPAHPAVSGSSVRINSTLHDSVTLIELPGSLRPSCWSRSFCLVQYQFHRLQLQPHRSIGPRVPLPCSLADRRALLVYWAPGLGGSNCQIKINVAHAPLVLVTTLVNLGLVFLAFVFMPGGEGWGWAFGAFLGLAAAIVAAAPLAVPALRSRFGINMSMRSGRPNDR